VTTSGGVPRDAPTAVVTRVRVRDVTAQPEYRASHNLTPQFQYRAGLSIRALAGKWIAIELPPVAPQPGRWHCGAERVWRVPAEEILRLGGTIDPRGNPTVCEHQVEID
jgi:hypothetical protein